MADTPFESLADSLLAALEEGIGGHTDAELQGGVLTVEGDGLFLLRAVKLVPTSETSPP